MLPSHPVPSSIPLCHAASGDLQGIFTEARLTTSWEIRFPTSRSDGEYALCTILNFLLSNLDDMLEAKVEGSSWEGSSSSSDPRERVVLPPLLGEGLALPTLGPCGR